MCRASFLSPCLGPCSGEGREVGEGAGGHGGGGKASGDRKTELVAEKQNAVNIASRLQGLKAREWNRLKILSTRLTEAGAGGGGLLPAIQDNSTQPGLPGAWRVAH